MTLSDRALSFAIRAHEGQFRRSEPDKPYVFHSIIVGLLLKRYGFDDVTIAAGYLHDIPEETNYTIDDIARLFGGDVASLVMTAIEPNQSLPWKDRKKAQIKAIDNLPERNLAVICADKIANLEDYRIQFRKEGKVDFSKFHAGKDDQEWFFRSMYDKISKGLYSPLVDRLAYAIHDVFDRAIDLDFYDDYSFSNTFIKGRITGYQEDLLKLKSIIGDTKPYIIEFTGTPKSGKTTIIREIKRFLEGADFRVRVNSDNEIGDRFRKEYISEKGSISEVERNLLISTAIKDDLMTQAIGDQDVIICEGSLFNALVHFRILLDKGIISEETFNMYLRNYSLELDYLVNHVVVCYTDTIEAAIRQAEIDMTDSSIFDQAEEISEYNKALLNARGLIDGSTIVDTTKINPTEASLVVADTLLPIMRKEYVLKLRHYLEENRGLE